MKAVVYTQYGSPDVLTIEEHAKPTPKDDEVVIKVYAASVNAADWRMLRAQPFLARLDGGLFRPRNTILGQDVAGVVESVGTHVTRFKVGDAVMGELFKSRGGGFAEYVRVHQDSLISKPANLSFEQAAAGPLAALTALQGLRDEGDLQAGESVLINGASGGVGTFAVQIAKHFGAEVTAVCSTPNLDLVRSIGADKVIDYTQADFTQNGQRYDLILELVGNRTIEQLRLSLKDSGRCVVIGFTALSYLFRMMLVGPWVSRRGTQKFGQMPTVQPNQGDLLLLKDLLETGAVVPVIDRTYPLGQTADAIRYMETDRARGKVVIVVAGAN